MKYLTRKSYVDVVGKIWMPAVTCSMRYPLSQHDVENIRGYGEGKISRDGLEQWLTCHSGDFQSLQDFSASIEDGENTLTFPWTSEDGELAYMDTHSEFNDE